MPEVMGRRFPKSKVGRPVRADISAIKNMADEFPGEVIGEVLNEADAQSVRRQFTKLAGYKVMTTRTIETGMRRVLVQKVGKRG